MHPTTSRLLLAGLTVVAAACSAGSSSPGHPPTAAHAADISSAEPPATGAVVALTPAPAAVAVTSPPGRCHTRDVVAAVSSTNGAAGTIYLTFVLVNRGASSCSLYGFVGMQMLDSAGRQLPTHVTRDSGRTPARFLLPSFWAATFLAHYSDVTHGNEGPCPMSARLEITPPDEFDHVTIPLGIAACNHGEIVVSPVLQPGALS